jgi:hypothetical protein
VASCRSATGRTSAPCDSHEGSRDRPGNLAIYCETGSVAKVEAELARRSVRRPKSTAVTTGRAYGGRAFTRGEIYRLLSNPVYVGEIGHKGHRYQGQYPAIVDRDTWAQARARLAANSHARHIQLGARDPSLLAGLLWLEYFGTGLRMGKTKCPFHKIGEKTAHTKQILTRRSAASSLSVGYCYFSSAARHRVDWRKGFRALRQWRGRGWNKSPQRKTCRLERLI